MLEGLPQLARGAQVGRYLALEPLGMGGAAVVYAAYDPELDRKVAVKLLRADAVGEAARLRLVREAQAIARLAHPNVVAVFDAGTWDGQVFLAMELVDGGTLIEWLAERARSWTEVRDVFVQAGRGLAAAHAAGLVHRDFKPSNVLLGRDGRARVSDFGLARPAESGTVDGDAGAGSSALDVSLTQTGDLLGTPRYMAPEQHQRRPADARSDQFSYCIALYEALYRQMPFEPRGEASDATTRLMAIAAEVLAGRVRKAPAGSGVPAWVHRVVVRGLSTDPAARFTTMDDLLGELRRVPYARARRAGAAAAVIALAGAAGWISTRGVGDNAAARPCEGAGRKLAGAWDDETRSGARTAVLAIPVPFAAATWATVEAKLDRYAADWESAHVAACEATRVHGEQSEALMDRRIGCLEDRMRELGALTRLLRQPDAKAVEKAAQAAASLVPVGACSNARLLDNDVMPPSAAQQAAVDATRDHLAEARAQVQLGRIAKAREVAEAALIDARAAGYRPVELEALISTGQARQAGGDASAAEPVLLEALLLAQELGLGDAEANAAQALAGVLGEGKDRFAEARRLTQMAVATAVRLDSPRREAEALRQQSIIDRNTGDFAAARDAALRAVTVLREDVGSDDVLLVGPYRALGAAQGSLGDIDASMASFTRAVDIGTTHLGPTHPAVISAMEGLGITSHHGGRNADARRYLERVLALRQEVLGPDHPQVGMTSNALAQVMSELGDHAAARPHAERALAIAEKLGIRSDVAQALNALGNLAQGQGDDAGALAFHRRALGEFEAVFGADHVEVGNVLVNIGNELAALGKHGDAVVAYRRATTIHEQVMGGDDKLVAHGLTGAGRSLLQLGRAREALAPLERAAILREAAEPDRYLRGETRFALAAVLLALRRDPVRARQLATDARADFAVAGEQGAKEVAEVDRWLAANRGR